ncbi:MAG: hypothetical protein H6636_01080 [Anaerolineales bacterium]|nr:hypothetical protein [Anaerolineales bacterium]
MEWHSPPWLATSTDGVHFAHVAAPRPRTHRTLNPGGCGRPRAVKIGDTFTTYTAYDGQNRPPRLATSKDLHTWEKHGLVFPTEADQVRGDPHHARQRANIDVLRRSQHLGRPRTDLIHWTAVEPRHRTPPLIILTTPCANPSQPISPPMASLLTTVLTSRRVYISRTNPLRPRTPPASSPADVPFQPHDGVEYTGRAERSVEGLVEFKGRCCIWNGDLRPVAERARESSPSRVR